jgi:hypothetical protein
MTSAGGTSTTITEAKWVTVQCRVDIEIAAYDETNTKIPVRRIIRRFVRNSNRGLVMMAGVQTNQFARALDIRWSFVRSEFRSRSAAFMSADT